MSGIRLPDCSKLAINWKYVNDVIIFWNDVIVKFVRRYFDVIFLVKFSYWSTFHVNIITGSGVMTISFYQGLTRNPEIGNNLVWVLPNIWRLWDKLGIPNLTRTSLNVTECCKMPGLLRVIKGKPIWGEGVKLPPPQIRVKVGLFLPKKFVLFASLKAL